MTSEPLMPIGMFSRACLLSVKSLRSYHEQGILVPAAIDDVTGYRSYHPSQLVDATVLGRLRALDLPLGDVKQILTWRDPEVTRKVLAEHHELMSERLAETRRIVEELQRAVDLPDQQTPVHVQTLEHQHALALSATVPSVEFSTFFDRAFPLLAEAANRLGFVICGAAGALYQGEIHDQAAEPVTAYIPVSEPMPVTTHTQELRVLELPRQQMAVLVHAGSYDSIGESYAALGSWVAYNSAGHQSPSDPTSQVREIYEVGVPDVEDPEDFRTRICWPFP